MGDLQEIDDQGKKVALVGTGRPMADWSGIDQNHELPFSPGQQRMIIGDAKYQVYRTEGTVLKFSPTGNLKEWKRQILERVEQNGYYAITHLKDPVDSNLMVCVISGHPRFTVDSAIKLTTDQAKLYDKYDKANDKEAVRFLTNSLDPDLATKLHQRVKSTDTFPVVFMRLIQLIRTTSIHYFESLKTKIRQRKPHQYPGQDISLMSVDNKSDADELTIAGQYDHNLTASMLTNFLEACPGETTSYHFVLLGLDKEMGQALIDVGYMEKDQATTYLQSKNLTADDICDAAENAYRTLFDKQAWSPARSPIKDSKTPHGHLAVGSVQEDLYRAYALIQQQNGAQGKAKPDDICLNCGKKGHWARDCPSKKGNSNRNKDKNKNGGKKQLSSDKDKKGKGKQGWKYTPPEPNGSTTMERRGKTFRWCAHCGCWSTTHGTDEHTNEKTKKQLPEANHLQFAWHVPFVPLGIDVCLGIMLGQLFGYFLKSPFGRRLRITLPQLIVMCIMSFALGIFLVDDVFDLHTKIYELVCAVDAAFGDSWINYIAPACWLLSAMVLLLPTRFQHRLIGSPPQEFHPFRMTKPKLKRYLRHCRRKRRSSSVGHKRHTRHYGLAQRTPNPYKDFDEVFELVQRVQAFVRSISDSRLAREGGNRSTDTRTPPPPWFKDRLGRWHSSAPSDPSPNPFHHFKTCERHKRMSKRRHKKYCKPQVYRPTVGVGMPMSHVAILASPAAQAYFLHADIPPRLAKAVNCFRASMHPEEIAVEINKISSKVESYPVIWDSGATKSISPYKSDFIGKIEPAPLGLRIRGIAQGLKVEGVGKVAWSVTDQNNKLRTIIVPAFYVPSAGARLLSIPGLLEAYPTETITFGAGGKFLVLSGSEEGDVKTSSVRVDCDPQTNLPTSMAYNHKTTIQPWHEFNNALSSTMKHNHNLSPAMKELLRWHDRLGHLNFKQIQFLLRTGVLAHSEAARRLQASASKITDFPLCPACQFGKQRRRPSPGKRTHVVRDRDGALKKDNLFPGQKVSVDHFVCSTKGRLLHTYGKEDPKTQFSGGCIFVDHASGYVYVVNQVHLDTRETLKAKQEFEDHLRDVGVIVSEYLSDNGSIFTSQEYTHHLNTFAQVNSFAGVGAHHHNGIAERSIQTIMSIARTMMMHQAIHWPEAASTTLWPLAVNHAVFLFNHMPSPTTGLSPHDLLSKTRWPQSELANAQVWGCPVYVLDKTMQDGKKLPRWKPRSTRQVYVGMSKKHASSVPLCLNPQTGAITSQFHIVFDPTFTTIATSVEDLPDFDTPEWRQLFGDSVYQYVLDDPNDPLQPPAEDQTSDEPPPLIERVRSQVEQINPGTPLDVVPPATQVKVDSPQDPSTHQREQTQTQDLKPVELPIQREPTPPVPPTVENPKPVPPVPPPPSQRENTPTAPSAPPVPPPSKPPTPRPVKTRSKAAPRRSRRSTKGQAPKKLSFKAALESNLEGSQPHANCCFPTKQEKNSYCSFFRAFFCGTNTEWETFSDPVQEATAYKVRAVKDPDIFTYNEAMNGPDRQKWCEAAKNEIEELEGKTTWLEVPMSDAKLKIIPGTWVFRVKRTPSGEIKKFKARYCVRGDLEETYEDEDTFAPTVAWSTVRLFLVLCLILGWSTVSVDFSNAFVQSKLQKPKWIHLPRGFISAKGPGTCLKLLRSLYGQKASPANWNKTAIEGFKKCGFKQSEFDPCLLYKKGMIIVLYVDDAGIGAKDPADIDKLIAQLRKLGFELKKEGNFNEFLGINFDKRKDGSIELTQTGLIDKILEAAGMTDCNPNRVPATGPLGSDPEGEPMDETWNYRSIVGMLLYLSTNTRPDITFAVSQVARFSSNPKKSHATAVKTILRYLKRTRTKGMIIKPTGKLNLDLFVDADFCGLYKVEPDTDPNSVRSRTGFIVKLSGCPLTWRSQLQTSITCSTLEAEYNALSSALKTLLPLKRLLIEATTNVQLSNDIISTIAARAFEDNQGAYYLATNHRITSRTRWYLNKWHWFWQHVTKDGTGPNTTAICELDTSLQDADFFTKALPPEPFEANRLRVLGW